MSNRQTRRAGLSQVRRREGGEFEFREFTRDEIRSKSHGGGYPSRVWISSEYIVQLYDFCPVSRLSMRRNDGKRLEGWALKQRIKELTIGDVEAVEMFPLERDVVDECNMYHLFFRWDGGRIAPDVGLT